MLSAGEWRFGTILLDTAWIIRHGGSVPLSAAVEISESLQAIWNECEDDVVMRRWLEVAKVPGAMWIKCTEICGLALCKLCCLAIRRRFPVPPTLAELMAARAR